MISSFAFLKDAWVWASLSCLMLGLVVALYRSRALAEKRVRDAVGHMQALNDFHRALLADLNLAPVLRRIVQGIVPNLGFKTATVYLFNRHSNILQGEVGHTARGNTTVSNVELPISEPGHLQAALFSPPTGLEVNGAVAVPILGPTPQSANALCWLAPEVRCTLTPKATLSNRREHCLNCQNFAAIGVLEATFSGRRPETTERLPDYAQASALAVRNAQLYRQSNLERRHAERRLDQLELIRNVSSEVERSLEVDRVLESMARGLERLGYARISVALVRNTPEGRMVRGHMTLVEREVRWTDSITRINFPIDAAQLDPFARVAFSGEPLVIRNAANEKALPAMVRAEARTIGYAPITATGARGNREVLGVLAVDHHNPDREINPGDLEVIATLGAQVGVAILNAREFEGLREREREARALAQLGQALTTRLSEYGEPAANETSETPNLTVENARVPWLDNLCDATSLYSGAHFAAITRLEQSDNMVMTRVVGSSHEARTRLVYSGNPRAALPGEHSTLTATALLERKPLLISNAMLDERATEEASGFGGISLLVLPLVAGNFGLGALTLGRSGTWTNHDIERLEGVAQQLALALENAELYRGLRAERAKLADVIEHLADGVILLEQADVLVANVIGRANAAARNLLGLSERFTPDALPDQLRATLGSFETLEASEGVQTSTLAVGEIRFQVAVTHRHGLKIVALRDLRHVEALENAKAELLSVVSHELRTPLTAIVGFVELLLTGSSGPLTSDQTSFLVTTLDASKNLHQTVLNLLNASTLEAGRFELTTKPAKLEFKSTLERYSRLTAERGIGFEVEVENVPKLNVDAGRLELVVANLLSNASRYTPAGGTVKFKVGIEGKHLGITVTDTGPGMSAAQLEKLFTRFTRGTDSREALEGAGLSLYVSRAIIAAHGGRIWAESKPDQGTIMRITLPLVPTRVEGVR
jgi:signal transduction histidine kinase